MNPNTLGAEVVHQTDAVGINCLQPTEQALSARLPELAKVESVLQTVADRATGLISSSVFNLFASGGKRIRPFLTICSGMCFGQANRTMIQAAAAAELIHMASLIHDDVIDRAATRRGKATINSQYGNQIAVLTGDYLFAAAFEILASNQSLDGMRYLLQAIKSMCEGEVNQAAARFETTLPKETYFCRVAKKTGILLAACCQSGAAAGGSIDRETSLMGKFGLNLGYAYQIIDDILDFTGNPRLLGKATGMDVRNGNITLPVIMLMESPVYGNWIKDVIGTKRINASGVESIKAALVNAGSIDQTYAVAADCLNTAKTCLEQIPAGEHKTMLLELAESLFERNV
ncbi:MAG TPA: polyprenyl synthetase family protein [Desulfobacteria bacterium]|nr:polyprenyl synthetase family protein [Desulfobacteria bacterium]